MDRIESAADIIVKINQYNNGELHDYELIREVCAYFDTIKNEPLTDADKQFLYYISNQIGLPQYFDTLKHFQEDAALDTISLQTLTDIVKESKLYTAKNIKIHRYQKEILNRFEIGKRNRYFLSASTSFGKTFLVYEVIRKMEYSNVLLLFPSIALLSESLEKIYSQAEYAWLKDQYKVHTITSIKELGEKNIFLYTPERYLSFLDVSEFRVLPFDFIFVDEVYKLDNDYIVDEEIRENERDVAYRMALHYALQNSQTDCMLAGPYIKFGKNTETNYNPSFDRFMEKYSIKLLDYNNYEIVNKDRIRIPQGNFSKEDVYKGAIHLHLDAGENVIVYCSQKTIAEKYARKIVEDSLFPEIDTTPFADFFQHIQRVFERGEEWIVVKALRKGVGIHHGLVPKYIQKEIINLFNAGYIKMLISTTTITEGVNTTAKNVLILSHKKGKKVLKVFDAKNIEGRAGRFLQHYKGNVYYIDKDYESVINADEEAIKHKYFDENISKDEVDLYYAEVQYLSQNDISRKREIDVLQNETHIPDDILNQFKVISKKDKILMYQRIAHMTPTEREKIDKLIRNYAINSNYINIDGFDEIVKQVRPFVRQKKLQDLMDAEHFSKAGTCSLLTILVYTYFKYGLADMIKYSYQHYENMTVDAAVRKSTDFVYNTLRYQVVKYFGAFNVMYKYYKSLVNGVQFADVNGMDSMLIRMEYNAKTQPGRIASDYGVPQKVLNYYDALEGERNAIRESFDNYERALYEKIDGFIRE